METNKNDNVFVPLRFMREYGLFDMRLLVFSYIYWFSKNKGICFGNPSSLAKKFCTIENEIIRIINDLENEKLLETLKYSNSIIGYKSLID